MTISWRWKLLVLIFSGFVYLIGQFYIGNWLMGTSADFICHPYSENGRLYCHSLYLDFGLNLVAVGEMFAVVGLLILFANRLGLKWWAWFSLVFVPIAAIVIIWFAPTPPAIVAGNESPDRVNLIWFFGYIYMVVTFLLVALARYRARTALQGTAGVGGS
jgi:hypothetical protein